jgi:formamidopyrimidine-DNA glycosylase
MPELAEVEYYRKQWDPGVSGKITAVELHEEKRIFRGTDVGAIADELPGTKLIGSEARGKQMAFRFSGGRWLAVHLGMTGELRVEAAGFAPSKHDHLVLRQRQRTLVFADPRMFGRVLYWQGEGEPPWWKKIPPALTSDAFTLEVLKRVIARRRRLPAKALLLVQDHFPGVGNWMADEILWRAKIDPRAPGESLNSRAEELWKQIRFVCDGAMKHVSKDFADPPAGWFFHVRWAAGGKCPRDGRLLERDTIGGRTTAWCGKCQR